MKIEYYFNYDQYESEVKFMVDTEKFTPEMAKETLEFFTWFYDEDNDPIEEVMKKYAIVAIKTSTFNNYNLIGVIKEFENFEGFVKVDGSSGVTLLGVSPYEFDEEKLELTITKQ